jgi:hypothetical protein
MREYEGINQLPESRRGLSLISAYGKYRSTGLPPQVEFRDPAIFVLSLCKTWLRKLLTSKDSAQSDMLLAT